MPKCGTGVSFHLKVGDPGIPGPIWTWRSAPGGPRCPAGPQPWAAGKISVVGVGPATCDGDCVEPLRVMARSSVPR